MMRRRARPGFIRAAGVLAVLVAGLSGCAGVSGTALPVGSRSPSSAASGAANPVCRIRGRTEHRGRRHIRRRGRVGRGHAGQPARR